MTNQPSPGDVNPKGQVVENANVNVEVGANGGERQRVIQIVLTAIRENIYKCDHRLRLSKTYSRKSLKRGQILNNDFKAFVIQAEGDLGIQVDISMDGRDLFSASGTIPNVQSLKSEPQGHKGKPNYLKLQDALIDTIDEVLSESDHVIEGELKMHPIRVKRCKNSQRNLNWLRDQWEANDRKCVGCLQEVPFETLTIDHVVPLHHGGPNVRENMQAMCSACNTDKGNLSMQEWHDKKYAQADMVLNENYRPAPGSRTYEYIRMCAERRETVGGFKSVWTERNWVYNQIVREMKSVGLHSRKFWHWRHLYAELGFDDALDRHEELERDKKLTGKSPMTQRPA